MSEIPSTLPVAAARLVGDPHPLCQQLGVDATFGAITGANAGVPLSVRDLPSLRGFLTWYRTELLVPVEMPAIRLAFGHAQRFEVRELIELDRRLGQDGRIRRFAEASQAVGRVQLWRLLPMRDQRLVRRYSQAMESGEAKGWHVIVYGIVLAVFSLPLRHGLLSYAQQTLAGFVNSASRSVPLPAEACQALLLEECDTLRSATERVLGPGKTVLQLCP